MTINFDANLILSWYQTKSGQAGGFGGGATNPLTGPGSPLSKIPAAPWNAAKQPAESSLVSDALGGKKFFNDSSIKLSVKDANPDYSKLFAVNQGLVTLQALANAANDPTTPSFQLSDIQSAFNRGVSELSSYLNTTQFSEFRIDQGIPTASETSTGGVTQTRDTYTAPPIATDKDAAVAAFAGDVQFDIQTTNRETNGTRNVHINLADLGATTRSVTNVANYINSQLLAAGSGIRVSVNETTTAAQTVTVNGKDTTITPAESQFGFQFTGLSAEDIKFSAATTSPAVFIAQTAGTNSTGDTTSGTVDGTGAQQELLKFEAGGGADATAAKPNDQNWVAGRVFSQKLPDGVSNVHATATGSDGSVYLLADATGTVAGQTIKGDQDVVLLKYDSSGQLAYARTLGAGATATGLSLAVSATGNVAIAGSVTGELDGGDVGSDPHISDSFVTQFDAKGDELWTQRQGGLDSDQAQALAFDAAGNLYEAGQTQSPLGGLDGYLRAYDTAGNLLADHGFGSTSDDKVAGLVISGTNVIVAGQDGSNGVLRSFDISNPHQPTLVATRDLGSLGGGSITGIGLDGGGNILIGGSSGADLNVAGATVARAGGVDAFGARIAADLSASADAIQYYGGTGDDVATAATIAGGQVWLTGTSKTTLPGLNPIGTQDGFVAALDVGAGTVTYSQRFTAKDQSAAPESIAVNLGGASVLDRFGLPTGSAAQENSSLLISGTSLRAGDQFNIKIDGFTQTITIDAAETVDTLVSKIQSAGLGDIDVSKTFGDVAKLSIKPTNDSVSFELEPGPPGQNALAALGLRQAIIVNKALDKKTNNLLPTDRKGQTYGLFIKSALSLDSKDHIKTTLDQLDAAVNAVRSIYTDLRKAVTPKDPTKSGTVPDYLKAQIANYQAGLNRLLSGGDGSATNGGVASLFG